MVKFFRLWGMDITPKQFNALLIELKKIREHLEQLRQEWRDQIAATRSGQESREKGREVKPVWVDAILTEYQEPLADRKKEADRQYRAQNSLRLAAWCTFVATFLAFGAAAYYAHWAKLTYFEIGRQTPKVIEAADASIQQALL